jgi:hypothetical protein
MSMLTGLFKKFNIKIIMAIIFKGCNYSIPMYPYIVKTDALNKTFTFTDSCRYDLQNKNQNDWNKLTGFTLGLGVNEIHQNSVRVAWRYNKAEDVIELTWYCYKEGFRSYDEKPFYKAKIGEPVNVHISKHLLHSDMFIVIINDMAIIVPVQFNIPKYGWLCFPFFGGDETTPHTMTIKVN